MQVSYLPLPPLLLPLVLLLLPVSVISTRIFREPSRQTFEPEKARQN